MLRIALVSIVFMLSLSGCSFMQSPPKTRIDLHLTGSDKLNKDLHGRPSPIVLRLYELKNPVAFEHAEFFTLYQQPQETLTLDLIAQEEVELRPGERRELNLIASLEGRYLAVLAAYRNLPDVAWRVVVPLHEGELNRIYMQLDELGISREDSSQQSRN